MQTRESLGDEKSVVVTSFSPISLDLGRPSQNEVAATPSGKPGESLMTPEYRAAHALLRTHQRSRPLDRNDRARITYLAEALERRTKRPRARNGLLGYTAMTVLRAFLFTFLRRTDGLCCPSIAAIAEATGLSPSTVHEALNRLERTGIMKRVQRLIRRVVDFGGVSRLTTVQTTNLYSFTAPALHAHLLPIERRASRTGTARLLAALTRSLTARTDSALRPGNHLRDLKGSWQGEAAARSEPSAYAFA